MSIVIASESFLSISISDINSFFLNLVSQHIAHELLGLPQVILGFMEFINFASIGREWLGLMFKNEELNYDTRQNWANQQDG